MKFKELPLKGAFLVELEKKSDERGFFARSFCAEEFGRQSLPTNFPQSNFSHNLKTGTLRGLHFQKPPHDEDKIVTCVRGSVFDVIVDIRKNSPTYLKWHSEILSAKNLNALFIPKGFAHGFQTLEDDSLLHYMMSEIYRPGFEAGHRWDDPKLAIEWPETKGRIISERDKSW